MPVDSSSTTDSQIERRRRLQADALQRVEAGEIRAVAGLHVGAAAAIEPVALDHRIEGPVRPLIFGPGRHHVDMRLQDQRAARLTARMVDADHDRRVGMLLGEGRAARMGRDRGAVHLEAVHGEAALLQRPEDEVLAGMLLATQRGKADQLLREGDLLGEARLDGGKDLVAKRGIERHGLSLRQK